MRPGRVKGRRRRREGTFIWFRPAAITMEKTMRTPLAPEMATTVGERWHTATERLSEYNRSTYTLGERDQPTSLFSTGETSEEKRKGLEAMGSG